MRTRTLSSAIVSALVIGVLTAAPALGQVEVTSAMRNAMWKGEIGSAIRLDSVARAGTFGLGPLQGLQGELMLWDGEVYVSRVDEHRNIAVRKDRSVGAPFFVRAEVNEWHAEELGHAVRDMAALEVVLNIFSADDERPFAFRLTGKVRSATVHVVNLPDGAVVRNPDDAHRGLERFDVKDAEVSVLGFFSRHHQAIFTHHDSFVHMHLMTADGKVMGHLEEMTFDPDEIRLETSVRFHN